MQPICNKCMSPGGTMMFNLRTSELLCQKCDAERNAEFCTMCQVKVTPTGCEVVPCSFHAKFYATTSKEQGVK